MINIRKLNKNEFGKIVTPKKIYKLKFKKELESVYQKLYFDNINYVLITNFFAGSIILSMIIYIFSFSYLFPTLAPYLSEGLHFQIPIYVGGWFVLNLLVYYILLLGFFFVLDSRLKKNETEIENALPEFIDSLVSNIKGGISLEKAILQSVRKEQKALLKEVTLMNEKIMMGKSVGEAMKEFRLRFNSPIINRTFFLMEEGLKGGGNLSEPLERISENLKRIYTLDEEIKSNSSGFTVVISFISVAIAPLLFALALTLLTFISNLFELLGEAETSFISAATVPPEFAQYLTIFSYAMIFLVTFFSSLIIAHLNNEKTYKVIKYLPVYIIISLIIYNVMSQVLLNFFGNLI